jgi:hypothetical protein
MVVNKRVMIAKLIPLAMSTTDATVFCPLKFTRHVPFPQAPPVTLSCPA